jgi:hypothetical protein
VAETVTLSVLRRVTYSDASPFNQKVPANAKVDLDSAAMVSSLLRDAQKQGFYVAVDAWTIPVYYADEETPRYDVALTASWASTRTMREVPIPAQAAPDSEEDGHMVIIDSAAHREYDLFQAKKSGGGWRASWGNSIGTEGSGVFANGASARGSGFALLAGLIWPDELKDQRIGHALIFSFNHTKSGGPVAPATESDGTSPKSDAIPEGARIQLDPGLDLDTLGLEPYEKTIAKALQEYGMILGDDGGGISLYAIHPMSVRGNPYAGVLPSPDPDYGVVFLPNIPVEKFRVVELGPQIPNK